MPTTNAPNDRHYNNAVLVLRKMIEQDGMAVGDALHQTIYCRRTGITPAQAGRLKQEATEKYKGKAA